MSPAHLAPFVVRMMLAWVPVDSPDELARYEEIAADIVAVADEAPVFDDMHGGARTALTIAAIASLESRFERDVDEFRRNGDNGRARGLLQVHRFPGEETCDSRLACLRVGRERIRQSFRLARALPEIERLGPFACGRAQRNPEGRARMRRALEAFRAYRREQREAWA